MTNIWKAVIISSLVLNAVSVFLVLMLIGSVGSYQRSIDGALKDSFEAAATKIEDAVRSADNQRKDTAMREQKMLRLMERQVNAIEEQNDLLDFEEGASLTTAT